MTDVDLPDDIIDMSDLDEILNVLVYGDSGIGKTVFSGGAGLIIATEKGVMSAKRQGSRAKIWPVKTFDDVRNAYAWLKDKCDDGECPFDWIALDSLTELQQLMLRDILDTVVANNSERDLDIPALQDHQKWQNMFKRFVKLFNDLEVNCLYTATPLMAEDEEGNTFKLPDFSGKNYGIASWVCAQMTAVGYMKKIRLKSPDSTEKKPVYTEARRIIWQKTPEIFAKDRSDALGRFTTDKSLSEISAMMKVLPMPEPVATPEPPKAPAKRRKAAPAKRAASNGASEAGSAVAVLDREEAPDASDAAEANNPPESVRPVEADNAADHDNDEVMDLGDDEE